MRTHKRAALAAAIALALSTPSAMAGDWLRDSGRNMVVPPTPMVSEKLFNPIEEAKNPGLPEEGRGDQALHPVGVGPEVRNVKLLAGGLPQAFSDAWRQRLHMRPIRSRPWSRSRSIFPVSAVARSRRHRVRRRRLRLQPHGHARRGSGSRCSSPPSASASRQKAAEIRQEPGLSQIKAGGAHPSNDRRDADALGQPSRLPELRLPARTGWRHAPVWTVSRADHAPMPILPRGVHDAYRE